jgi:cobalamin transport system substrate-binding protein
LIEVLYFALEKEQQILTFADRIKTMIYITHRKASISLLLLVIVSFVLSCTSDKKGNSFEELFSNKNDIKSSVKYAEGFDIYETEGVSKLVIYDPRNKLSILTTCYFADSGFYVVNKSSDKFSGDVNEVAVFSATQLSAFSKLDLLDKVIAISESEYIQNSDILDLYKKGVIVNLASNGNFFLEKTLEVNPDIIFYSPYNMAQSHPLAVTEITMIPFFDFRESDPLGRAEWIKFTALFFNKEKEAGEIFDSIEMNYNIYKDLGMSVDFRPTVFSDKYYSGQWFVPGGDSYIAKMFDHAGANYLWKDNDNSGSVNMDFEVVYEKAHNADFWRIVGSYPSGFSYDKLGAENDLYNHFDAFTKRNIIFCDSQQSSYFEKGTLEPHVLLADLIYAFHPELLQGYIPTYYHHFK